MSEERVAVAIAHAYLSNVLRTDRTRRTAQFTASEIQDDTKYVTERVATATLLLAHHANVTYRHDMMQSNEEVGVTKLVWSKPWYRSRGVWGAIIGAAGTAYGLWAGILPCGPWQTLHNYAAACVALYGAYLAFVGRRTASQPIHIFWRQQTPMPD